MDRRDWLELNVMALAAWFAAVTGRSRDSRLIEFDGVVAGVNPAVPGRSVFNSVAYTDPRALEAHYTEIAAAYSDAGCAWTVWVREDDTATAAMLERAGHTLDAQPRAMGTGLVGIEEPDLEGMDWTPEGDLEDLFAVNDRAYGWEEGTWRSGLGALPDPSYIYVARVDGEPDRHRPHHRSSQLRGERGLLRLVRWHARGRARQGPGDGADAPGDVRRPRAGLRDDDASGDQARAPGV